MLLQSSLCTSGCLASSITNILNDLNTTEFWYPRIYTSAAAACKRIADSRYPEIRTFKVNQKDVMNVPELREFEMSQADVGAVGVGIGSSPTQMSACPPPPLSALHVPNESSGVAGGKRIDDQASSLDVPGSSIIGPCAEGSFPEGATPLLGASPQAATPPRERSASPLRDGAVTAADLEHVMGLGQAQSEQVVPTAKRFRLSRRKPAVTTPHSNVTQDQVAVVECHPDQVTQDHHQGAVPKRAGRVKHKAKTREERAQEKYMRPYDPST